MGVVKLNFKIMDRIKNLNEVIIGDFDVLIGLIEPEKSKLIMPDSMAFETGENDYSQIIKVGKEVTKFSVGDIVMKFNNKNIAGFIYKDKKYLLVPSTFISIAVKEDNFDVTAKKVLKGKPKLKP